MYFLFYEKTDQQNQLSIFFRVISTLKILLISTIGISRKLKWITEVVKVSSGNSKKTTTHLLKSTDRTILECITLYSKNSLLIKSQDMKNTWLSTIAKCLKHKLNTSFKKSNNNELKDLAA